MDWSFFSQIASMSGTMIAAGSLLWGILLFYFSQRNTYISSLRKAISRCRSKSKKAAYMLQNYEMTSEIVSRVVYSKELEFFLSHVFDKFFREKTIRSEHIKEYLYKEGNVPTIRVPVHTPLYRNFQETIDQVTDVIAHYQIDYPGLFRVLYGIAQALEGLAEDIKKMSQDEQTWIQIILSLEPNEMSVESVEEFKSILTQEFVDEIMNQIAQTVDRIESANKMLDLVSNSYLSKKENKLHKLKRKARRVYLIPMEKTTTLMDDLEEAEKMLRHALEEDELVSYRTILERLR